MRTLFLMALILFGLSAWALPNSRSLLLDHEMDYLTLTGSCDAIVVVKATSVMLPQLPKSRPLSHMGPMYTNYGTVTWIVDKSLKGNVDVKAITTNVHFLVKADYKSDVEIVTGWENEVVEGQRYIIGLVKTRMGWEMFRGGFNSIFPIDSEKEITDVIAHFPLEVFLITPDRNQIIDSKMKYTFKVKNTGDKPVNIHYANVDGLWNGPGDVDMFISRVIADDLVVYNSHNLPELRIIAPGKEELFSITVTTKFYIPWQALDTKFLTLQTLVSANLEIGFNTDKSDFNSRDLFFLMKSNEVPVTFVPPAKVAN